MVRNAAVRPPPQFYRRFRTLAGGAKWYRGAMQPFALIARMAPKGVQKVYRQKRQGRRSFAEGVKTPGAMLSRPQSEETPPRSCHRESMSTARSSHAFAVVLPLPLSRKGPRKHGARRLASGDS
jgi:hypothetical protein